MSITILGLGPGDPQALTLEARDEIANATEIFLRTREHPTVAALPKHLRVHSFDHLYEKWDSFDAIYSAIADDIVKRGAKRAVLYAVPGHPLFGETSVQKILAQARDKNIPTRVVAGLSFVDAACAALALDPLARGLQVSDATDLAQQHFPQLDPDQPALVGQLYSRAVASDCKLTLLVLFPPEHAITLIDAAGTPEQRIVNLPLAELDHSEHWATNEDRATIKDRPYLMTTLYVPPLPRPSSFDALAEIVAHLRSPSGCPWDREQTHQSLRGNFLEDAYEVMEALDEDDMPHLREELGDLMLHILLQTQIAQESGEFLLTDVVAEIAAKLVRRHPHVFGDVQVSGTADIIANWEMIKQAEKAGKPKKKASMPRGLPALVLAKKVARKKKEAREIREIAAQVEKLKRAKNREKALGEILYEIAAYAAAKGIDAESALRTVARERMNHD
ncbi:MAG: MazG family protein [Chloroflexi bacterium]|nr:MazG family protein [Chloroflexota bacterium]